jgi:hypothetical protein
MSVVAIIDFETTSADAEVARPWEFGVVITAPNSWDISYQEHFYIWDKDYPDMAEGAKRACRITWDQMPKELFYVSPKNAIKRIQTILSGKRSILGQESHVPIDFVLAYNNRFDRTILEKECERQGVRPKTYEWLCGLQDIPYPPHYRCKQLSHIALDHGIVVNPESLHGALADVKLFVQMMQVGGYKIEDILAYIADPWVILQAHCDIKPWHPGGKELNDAVKADGYSWQTCKGLDEPVFDKTWVKRIKKSQLEIEKQKQLPFKRSVAWEEQK